MAAQNKLHFTLLSIFLIGLLGGLQASACDISSCQSKSKSCQSTCGPGNPAGKAGIGNYTAGKDVRSNAIQQQMAAGQQQANIAAAQGHCSSAKSASDSACQSAISSCQSQPGGSAMAQQAKQAKQACESAEKQFMSQTGSDMDASKMMQQLAQMAQGLMQKKDPSENPKDDKKKPTKCDRYNDMLSKEKDHSKRKALKNLIAKKCSILKKQEGKSEMQAANVRAQEGAVRESGEPTEVDITEIGDKEQFLRKMLKCDAESTLPECCLKPENERFCKNNNFEEARGVEAGPSLGTSSIGSGSRKMGKGEKVTDNEIASGETKKKLPSIDISFAGGGGGGVSLGSSDGSYDEESSSGGTIKKPTVDNVKLASQVMTAKAQVGHRGHDMFGAVTKRMRQNYMRGNLIQTQGVLFKRR